MAVMNDNNRRDCWADFMRTETAIGAVTKADLRAAVDGLDDYFHSSAAAINSAIPQPARGLLTTSQKARLAAAVLLKRFNTGA